MPTTRGNGKIWGLSFPQDKGVPKRGPRGEFCIGINPNSLS